MRCAMRLPISDAVAFVDAVERARDDVVGEDGAPCQIVGAHAPDEAPAATSLALAITWPST